MVWKGTHHSLLSQPGMLRQMRGGVHVQQVVQHERLAARLRRRLARIADVIGKMINTSLSCVPPIVQLAGTAALEARPAERDEVMQQVPQEGRAARRRA